MPCLINYGCSCKSPHLLSVTSVLSQCPPWCILPLLRIPAFSFVQANLKNVFSVVLSVSVPPWFFVFLIFPLLTPDLSGNTLGFVENNVLSRLNSTSRCTLCALESFQVQFIPASPELALCVERFCLGCGTAALYH